MAATVHTRRAAGSHQLSDHAGSAFIGPRAGRPSTIKRCAPTQAGAGCNRSDFLPASSIDDGMATGPGVSSAGDFSCASGGALRTLPEHIVNEFAQDIRAGRDIPGIFMQHIGAQHVEPLQPVAINLHFKSLGSARVWSRHGRIRKSWFHRNIRLCRIIVNNSEETPISSLTFFTEETYYQGINNTGAPMKSLLPLAAAAAFFLGVVGQARAEADDALVPYTTVGHWQIMSSDTECRAHSYYQNGTTLGFYINVSGGVSIGIGNPKWNIPEGDYEVSAQVDRTKPGHMTARGNRTWIVFGIVGSEGDMNLLSYGRTLYVTVGAQVYQYELIRSEAMLKALGQCAATRMASANPFSGAPPAATSKTPPVSTETPSNPFRRL